MITASLKRLGVLGAALLTLVALAGLAPAHAATDTYGYAAYAGGSMATAVGTTVSSDLTAESSIAGTSPSRHTNKVASARVANLLQLGAITTDTTATAAGKGFAVTAHARTAGINLLNGLIRATAVDTTSTAVDNGSATPTASTKTELIGLTIAGKKYPLNLPDNTGITIPGVASVLINSTHSAVKDDAVVTMGAGLIVTLLKQRNGFAAGAEVMLNPTYLAIQPATRAAGGAQLGGVGYGAYVFAHVGDQIRAESGVLGAKWMPLVGTNGAPLSNTTARVNVPGVVNASAISSTVVGTSTPALSESTVSSGLVNLKLFPSLFGGLIQAKAIGVTAHTRIEGNSVVNEGSFQFVNLRIAGKLIPIDVAPNTSIHVANLGTVTLNEQKSETIAGVVHGFHVTGLHIVLDTARAGLPVGAEIQVGVAQSQVWE